jgi:hypothetical protein
VKITIEFTGTLSAECTIDDKPFEIKLARFQGRVYRSSRTLDLLRILRQHGTLTWFQGWPTLPSASAFRKLCEHGLIEARRAFLEKSPGRDVVLLEATITKEGRQWIDDVDKRRGRNPE